MYVFLGAASAVGAGASFAGAGVLQQRAAVKSARPSLSLRLLTSLGHQPLWLAGIGLATVGNGFQAFALSLAPLALVQPLLITELLFAIPTSSWLYRRPLGRREWRGILAVTLGLAATVWGAAPHGTGGTGTFPRWVVIGGGVVILGLVLAVLGRGQRGEVRASLFAAAAALVFAVYSTLLAATVAGFVADGLGVLATPVPYVMTLASLGGLLLIQSAFQAGPLAVTMPMVDWLQPLVAVLLGVTVLGESLETSAVHVSVLAAGALSALFGILVLDTSPRVRSMQHAVALAAARAQGGAAGVPAPDVDAAAAACATRAARRGHGRGNPRRRPVGVSESSATTLEMTDP